MNQTDFKCANCKGSHSAAYRGCPYRKNAQKVIEITTKTGVSKETAKAIVKEGKSYAAATKGPAPAPISQQHTEGTQTHVTAAAAAKSSKKEKQKKPPVRSEENLVSSCTLNQIVLLLAKLVEIIATSAKNQTPELSGVTNLAQQIIVSHSPTEDSNDDSDESSNSSDSSDSSTISVGDESEMEHGNNSINHQTTTQKKKKKKRSRQKKNKKKKKNAENQPTESSPPET